METLAVITGISLLGNALACYKLMKGNKQEKPVEKVNQVTPEEERRGNRYDDMPSLEDFGNHLNN